MNLTVNNNSNISNPAEVSGKGFNLLDYSIVAAMFLYAFLSFGIASQDGSSLNFLVLLLVNMLIYFMTIFLYFGIARLSYKNRNYLLWGGAAAAFVCGYLFNGLSSFWQLIMSFSALLFAGTLMGRLTLSGKSQLKIYMLGMIPVIIFTIGLFVPIWKELIASAGEYFNDVLDSVQRDAVSLGYGADAVAKSLVGTRKMVEIFTNIIPSVLVLSAVMQFTAGYFVFAYQLQKENRQPISFKPFYYWKMPFMVVPLVLAGLTMHLLGNELIAQIGDNILAFLVVFYAATGLGLIEFYLRRFKFSLFFKILFYIMLFFTQIIGFFASALLGFIDSFTDWRKVQQLNYEKN